MDTREDMHPSENYVRFPEPGQWEYTTTGKSHYHDVNYCSRARMVSLFVFSKADEIVCCFVFSRQGRQEFLRGR